MPSSPRQVARSAVGLAAVAPAIGLIVLSVALVLDGGLSGFLAGILVAGIALSLLFAALVMTYAPVSIANLLADEEAPADGENQQAGTNGGPEH